MNKKFAKNEIPKIAQDILSSLTADSKKQTAVILALSGDLGAGKTTLTQAIARELGITENVISPTFVIMKTYRLPSAQAIAFGFSRLTHIDAYRLNSSQELLKLGWQDLIADPKNLILIEWPERVADIIPKTARRITLSHKNENEREIHHSA